MILIRLMLSLTLTNRICRIANFATLIKATTAWDKVERSVEQVAELGVRMITEYPFLPIPQAVIDQYPLPAQPQLAITLVAFRTLSSAPAATFNTAYALLLPEKHQYQPLEGDVQTRRQVFTDYFESKLSELVDIVNGEGGVQEKNGALAVLNQLSLSFAAKESVKAINLEKIKEESGLLIAFYLMLLLKHRLPHQNVLPELTTRLGKGSTRQQIQTARCLFTLPNYSTLLPPNLLDSALLVLSKHLALMDDDECLVLLRFIYEYVSPASKQFAGSLRDKLKQRPAQIALILKTLKYCQLLRIEHDSLLVAGVQQGLGRLANTLMFMWKKGVLSAEASQLLEKHIAGSLKHYVSAEEIVDEELIKFIKLTAKHMWNLSVELQAEVKQALLSNILPKYEDQTELIYESLMLLLQLPRKNNQNEEESQLLLHDVQKYIQIYFNWCCLRNHMGQMRLKHKPVETVQLLHLILARKLPIPQSDLPLIANYAFQIEEVQLSGQLQAILACLLNSPESSEQLKTALNHLIPIAEFLIKKRRLTFKGTMQLLSVTHKAGYQQQLLFRKIQRSIFEMLEKFPHFTINYNDLHLIKQTMLKRRLSSLPFEKFIYEVISHPSKWEQLRAQYVAGERQFQSKQSKFKSVGKKK